MVKEPVLAKCLFEFPTYARLTHMNVEDVLLVQDEAALTFAKLNMSTAFCRIKRLTFMLRGPSPNTFFFAGGDVCEKEALARLQRDVDNDIYFRSIADDVTGIRELVDRSVFDWIANKQIVGVLKAVDFRPTTDTHKFFQNLHTRLLASQIVEDGFNCMKHSRPYQNRCGSMESAFDAVIVNKV